MYYFGLLNFTNLEDKTQKKNRLIWYKRLLILIIN